MRIAPPRPSAVINTPPPRLALDSHVSNYRVALRSVPNGRANSSCYTQLRTRRLRTATDTHEQWDTFCAWHMCLGGDQSVERRREHVFPSQLVVGREREKTHGATSRFPVAAIHPFPSTAALAARSRTGSPHGRRGELPPPGASLAPPGGRIRHLALAE